MRGIRGIPDRRPRYSIWIEGRPRSLQAHGSSSRYTAKIQSEARKQVDGPPLASSRLEVDIIFGARGDRPDVDNVSKLILDALRGIVYHDDKQVRAVKIVGLRLDEPFRARGSPEVSRRLVRGKEFLINVYESLEVDVYLMDSKVPGDERPAQFMLSVARIESTPDPPDRPGQGTDQHDQD